MLKLALAPFSTYRNLGTRREVGRLGALQRPVFIALLVGTLLALTSTGRITLGLVLAVAACWSFVPAIQAFAGFAVIARSPHRTVGRAQALDLLFAGHAPWSLWLLAVAARIAWLDAPASFSGAFLATAWIPLAWRCVIVFAFCRSVLLESRRGALLRTAAHQAIVWSLGIGVLAVAVRLWPRIVGAFGG